MAKVWSDFHNLVVPEAPGCSLPSADQAIREAAIDFFDRTGLVVHQPSDITVVPGTATYALTAPAGYAVMRVEELFIGDQRLEPAANTQLAQMYFNWLTIAGSPLYYTQETSDTVRLVPEPDVALSFPDAMVARVVVAPSRAATGFAEDWVFEKWADEISAGAISRLLRQAGKPWADLQRAAAFEVLFRQGWSAARGVADRGKAGAVLSVRLKRHF